MSAEIAAATKIATSEAGQSAILTIIQDPLFLGFLICLFFGSIALWKMGLRVQFTNKNDIHKPAFDFQKALEEHEKNNARDFKAMEDKIDGLEKKVDAQTEATSKMKEEVSKMRETIARFDERDKNMSASMDRLERTLAQKQ